MRGEEDPFVAAEIQKIALLIGMTQNVSLRRKHMNELVERTADQRLQVKVGEKLDIIERIQSELPYSKGQHVIVKQVGPLNFRANWFQELEDDTMIVKATKIVDSRFLHVVQNGNSLIITDLTIRRKTF